MQRFLVVLILFRSEGGKLLSGGFELFSTFFVLVSDFCRQKSLVSNKKRVVEAEDDVFVSPVKKRKAGGADASFITSSPRPATMQPFMQRDERSLNSKRNSSEMVMFSPAFAPLVSAELSLQSDEVLEEDSFDLGRCKSGEESNHGLQWMLAEDGTSSSTDQKQGQEDYDVMRMEQQQQHEDSSSDSDMQLMGDVVEFCPFAFMKSLPPREYFSDQHRHILRDGHLLPQRDDDKPCLVLDLDETLVHSSVTPVHDADFVFPVDFDGQTYRVYAKKRPFCDEFLEEAAKHFELVVFTASKQVYADRLLDLLDPNGYVQHRLFREHCVSVGGNLIKDLQIINRPLHRTVIVDNSPQTFGFQVSNGVPIESWFEDPLDRELARLLPFLKEIAHMEDMRPAVLNKFRLHEKVQDPAITTYKVCD